MTSIQRRLFLNQVENQPQVIAKNTLHSYPFKDEVFLIAYREGVGVHCCCQWERHAIFLVQCHLKLMIRNVDAFDWNLETKLFVQQSHIIIIHVFCQCWWELSNHFHQSIIPLPTHCISDEVFLYFLYVFSSLVFRYNL